MQRMDRSQFFDRLAGIDEERLKKALWNLYWRGSKAMQERIEAELAPPSDRAKQPRATPVVPALLLDEVREFVALVRSGAYLGGDRRVSPRERTTWRLTFQRLAGDAQAALQTRDIEKADRFDDAAAAMELLIDLACEMKDHEYVRSEDPVAAARFVVSDAAALLWSKYQDQYGFAGLAQRAAPQLIRWESRYGWTRHGGPVGEREIGLAELAARMVPALDGWVTFTDAYLDVLDQYATVGRPDERRSRGFGSFATDYPRRRRAEELAAWHHMVLDRLADSDADDRLDRLVDHSALAGPEVVFLRARLAQSRADEAQARELMSEALRELPGHTDFLAFAEEIGAPLPPRAREITAERAHVENLINGAVRPS